MTIDMRFSVTTLLTALLAFASGLYMPWWSAALAALLVAAFVPQRVGWSVLAGTVGMLLLWGLMAFFISRSNGDILAHRMAQFILKKDDPLSLILMTAVLGAITGALGALTGSLARRAFKPID